MRVVDISKFESRNSDSWISVHDIGKMFNGVVLDVDEYLAVESRYVQAIGRLIAAIDPPELTAHQIEFWEQSSSALAVHGLDDVFDGAPQPREGEQLPRDRIPNLTRRCLRDVAWLEVIWAPNFLLHFGYDYHVVIAFVKDAPEITKALDEVWKIDGLHVRRANSRRATLDEWRGYK